MNTAEAKLVTFELSMDFDIGSMPYQMVWRLDNAMGEGDKKQDGEADKTQNWEDMEQEGDMDIG